MSKPLRNGPLKSLSDAEVLKRAARYFVRRAQELPQGGLALEQRSGLAAERDLLTDTAFRLRSIARRVPLWVRPKA